MVKKYLIGFMILVVLTASVYILIPDKVRIDVENTKTTIKVFENNSWVLAGTERTILYDGTKKMRASSRNVNYSIEDNFTTIQRTSYFKDGIIAIDIYEFDGSTKDVELYPISHQIRILGGQGKIFLYEVNDLYYEGETIKGIESPALFGHNIKIEWDLGNYYSKIFKYSKKDIGKLSVRYRIDSDDFMTYARLFDPPGDAWIDGTRKYRRDTNGTGNIATTKYDIFPLNAAVGDGTSNIDSAGSSEMFYGSFTDGVSNNSIYYNDDSDTILYSSSDESVCLFDTINGINTCSNPPSFSPSTYYTLDFSTGAVQDLMGNTNLTNTGATRGTSAVLYKGATFGTGDYMNGTITKGSMDNSIIMGYIKPTGTSGNTYLGCFADDTTLGHIGVKATTFNDSHFSIQTVTNNGTTSFSHTVYGPVPKDVWYHVFVEFTNSTYATLFVDGVEEDSSFVTFTGGFDMSVETFSIGECITGGGDIGTPSAIIDDVRTMYSATYSSAVPDFYLGLTTTILGAEEAGQCSPTLNANWVITDAQICDGVSVTTGTGSVVVNTGGDLILINGAIVTASGLEINKDGEAIFLDSTSQLRI